MPRLRAIIFDLLTALIDSWTLWGDIAGDDELGAVAARAARKLGVEVDLLVSAERVGF